MSDFLMPPTEIEDDVTLSIPQAAAIAEVLWSSMLSAVEACPFVDSDDVTVVITAPKYVFDLMDKHQSFSLNGDVENDAVIQILGDALDGDSVELVPEDECSFAANFRVERRVNDAALS